MKKLKSIIGIGIAFVLIMTSSMFVNASQEVDYSEKTITMAQAEGKYKTQGRTGLVGTGLSIDSTASGIEFNADCKGSISVNLKVQASWNHAYITAIVDGNRKSHIEARTSSANMEDVHLEIASDLTKGSHSVCIYNETESPYAIMSIESIELSGELTTPPKDNDLFIEFIGDSYFASYGNLIKNTDTSVDLNDTPLISDGAQSFGVFTANELNADYSILAASGYGLVAGFSADANVPKYYDYTSWERSHTGDQDKWNFSRQADVVVVELGDNDLGFRGTNGVTADSFTEGVRTFIEKIRSKNPNAKIVWILYGWENRIKQVVEELGGADAGLYTKKLELAGTGAMNHPTVQELKNSSAIFASYLKNTVLNIESASSSVTSSTNNTAANNANNATNNTTSPKTGNSMPITLFLVIGSCILFASVVAVIYNKKHLKSNKHI